MSKRPRSDALRDLQDRHSRSPYEVLGVPRDADARAIKRAYRKLAQEHHPDKCPGDEEAEEKFKLISEAYEFLCDSEKRATFDRESSAEKPRRRRAPRREAASSSSTPSSPQPPPPPQPATSPLRFVGYEEGVPQYYQASPVAKSRTLPGVLFVPAPKAAVKA